MTEVFISVVLCVASGKHPLLHFCSLRALRDSVAIARISALQRFGLTEIASITMSAGFLRALHHKRYHYAE